jgi:hypothetical protein
VAVQDAKAKALAYLEAKTPLVRRCLTSLCGTLYYAGRVETEDYRAEIAVAVPEHTRRWFDEFVFEAEFCAVGRGIGGCGGVAGDE